MPSVYFFPLIRKIKINHNRWGKKQEEEKLKATMEKQQMHESNKIWKKMNQSFRSKIKRVMIKRDKDERILLSFYLIHYLFFFFFQHTFSHLSLSLEFFF